MVERLTITGIGRRGDGVVQSPAGPIYVPATLPGEVVEVEPFLGPADRRHLIRVEVASPERIDPICPHFGTCGGCSLQHWTWDRYQNWKRGLVLEALEEFGITAEVDTLVDAHGAGRRRAVFHAKRATHDVLAVGFAAQRSHDIVAIDRCPILAQGLDHALEIAWEIGERLRLEGKPLDIHVTATDTGLDIDVRGSGRLTPKHMAELAKIADQRQLARVTRHGELVAQRIAPTLKIGRAMVALPPGAFLQATAEGEATLARLIDTHLGDARQVADLFSGIGPFALRLAEHARVDAFDSDAPAIAALTHAVANAPGLKPVAATARDLFRRPLQPSELKPYGAVVFDPPRQGAEAQARELAKSKVPAIVSVSCNPRTFARDLRILLDGGYRLGAITPVDQFRYSAHVEIVAKLMR